MIDEKKLEKAVRVFRILCQAVEDNGWSYDCDDTELSISFQVNGEDLPMNFIIMIDIERQMIRFYSPLTFEICEEKRIEAAVAVCAATHGMADGKFSYNIAKGSIMFELTAVFMNSTVGEGLLQYMIHCACFAVDQYNDKFLALNKGFIGIEEFIKE